MEDTAKKRTPAQRLQWWKDFGKIIWESATLVRASEEYVAKLLPEDKQKAFAEAMGDLYDVLQALWNNHVKKVVEDLEAGNKPEVPDVDLPDLPDWKPGDPKDPSTFENVCDLLLPILIGVAERIGKDSDAGLAVLEVVAALEEVINKLHSD